VVKIKKYGGFNKPKPKDNVHLNQEDELKFILWKAELNKELTEFWKAISR
jgi:hypothetical protein